MEGNKDMSVRVAAHEALDRTCKDSRLSDLSKPILPANIAWVFDFIKVFSGHFVDVLKECMEAK